MEKLGIREALAVDSDFTHRFIARPGPKRGRLGLADAPSCILRERWRRSSLPSVPSALRGLDLRQQFPFPSFIGASTACDGHNVSTITQKPQRGSIKARSRPSAREAGEVQRSA